MKQLECVKGGSWFHKEGGAGAKHCLIYRLLVNMYRAQLNSKNKTLRSLVIFWFSISLILIE